MSSDCHASSALAAVMSQVPLDRPESCGVPQITSS
ncbi:hypothetical protein M3J09_006529 [Ascochyta lentis]